MRVLWVALVVTLLAGMGVGLAQVPCPSPIPGCTRCPSFIPGSLLLVSLPLEERPRCEASLALLASEQLVLLSEPQFPHL